MLELAYNRITHFGSLSLVKSPKLRNLRSLDLEMNSIGKKESNNFPDGTVIPELSILNLRKNKIGDDSVVF